MQVDDELLEQCRWWLDKAANQTPDDRFSSRELSELRVLERELDDCLGGVPRYEPVSKTEGSDRIFASQSATFPTQADPDSEVLRILEKDSHTRLLGFVNLTSQMLSFMVQRSADGGNTWRTTVPRFALEAGNMTARMPKGKGILRVIGGGADDPRGVKVLYTRCYPNKGNVWRSSV